MHNVKNFFIGILKVLDIVLCPIAFFAAWYIKFESNIFRNTGHLNLESYLLILLFYIILFFVISNISNFYKVTHNSFGNFANIVKVNVIVVILIVVILYLLKWTDYSRVFLFIFTVLNILFNNLSRIAIQRIILLNIKNKKTKRENILIIGRNELTKAFEENIKKYALTFNLIGYLGLDNESHDNKTNVLGEVKDLEKILEKYNVDEIIIALRIEEYHLLDWIISICEKYGIRTYIIPDYLRYIPSKAQVEEFEGIPLINIRYSPLDEWPNRFIKRTFDIVVSLFGLILCLPLFIIIAILIKLTSEGPILFTQERVGYNRRIFKMHKFRTMYVQDPNEEKVKWTTKDDPRRTPIGRILRKLSLDELPQLWDVLIGNMSLVGPRPERPYFVEKFKEEIPKYMIKHRVRPGITGWAQIHGWRGDTSIEERIKYDIWYIENWSFWLDIKIILATIFGGKFMENAY
jgi:Undecaprenyl-phosphate glucose phosphotransferase